MATLDEQFEDLLRGPPTSNEEFEGLLRGPVADQMNEMFGMPPPLRDPTIDAASGQAGNIVTWVQNNPQAAARLLGQMLGGGVGAFVGTPAGPPGQALLGGLGTQAGDIIARTLTGQPAPTLEEGAITAGLGAAGPMAGPLLRGSGAALGRAFTHTRGEAGRNALLAQSGDLAAARSARSTLDAEIAAGATPGVERLGEVASAVAAPRTRASNIAREAAAPGRVIGPAGIVFDIASGNISPTRVALWLGAGAALPPIHEAAVRRMLMNPQIVDRMRTTVREALTTGMTEAQIARNVWSTVLAPVLPEYTRGPSGARPEPRAVEVTEWGTRDISTGRFTSGD